MADKWIFWFEEIGQEHSELVGKKLECPFLVVSAYQLKLMRDS